MVGRSESEPSITLNQLRAFLEAARLGSFTAAAEAMAIAQASVSELVRRLEEELDARMFVRGSRRLTLTTAGQELLPYAQQVVMATESGTHAVRSLGSLAGGTATFGVPRNADFYYLLSGLVHNFHSRYPAVRVRLVGQNSAETAQAVQAGEVEAGLVVLPIDDDDLVLRPLVRDEVFYVSSDPTNTQRPVTIQRFAKAKLVLYDAHYAWTDPTRRQLAERAKLAGIRIDAEIEVEHSDAALRLAASGVGDTLAAGAVIDSATFPTGLHTAPFTPPLYDTIALITPRSRPVSNATREFAKMARAAVTSLSAAPGNDGSPVPILTRPIRPRS